MTRPDALVRAVEAVLFAADAPLTLDAIRAHVGAIATARDVRAAIEVLVEDYAGRGFGIVRRGDRWQFQTAPDLAHVLRRESEEPRRLSRAGIETFLPASAVAPGAERFRRSALASSFVAALELARQGRVELRQAAPFAPLYLRATTA